MTADIPVSKFLDDLREAAAIEALIQKLHAAGHSVHCDKAGGYTVSRWAMSRHCIDALSLREFAKQVGVSDAPH